MEASRLEMIGEPCGHHGPYTFYKAFKYLRDDKYTTLSLGQFFFLKILNGIPVCIGELQLVWQDKSTSQELASVRLYFRPEDTPEGRGPHHGQDEILALSDKMVLKLDDLVALIVRGVKWTDGRKGILDTDHRSIDENNEEEKMAELFTINTFGFDCSDIEKERQMIGDRPDKSSTNVCIMSYSKYCRYRCVLKRLENCADKWIKNAIVCAMGGVTTRDPDNLVFFCRGSCEYPELDDLEFRCDHLAPNLKGRPRKRKGLRRDNSDESDESGSTNSTPTKPTIKIRFGKRATPLRNGLKLEKDKVSTDEQAFLIDLHKFMKSRNTPIGRIPSLGFKQIDLYHFYSMAERIGGYEQITAKRMWKYLYDQLGGNPGSTSAATCTRRHYEKLLLPYERHMRSDTKHFLKKKINMAMVAVKRAKIDASSDTMSETVKKLEVNIESEVKDTERMKVNGNFHQGINSSISDSQQKALIIKKEIQKMKMRKNAQRLMEKDRAWNDRRKHKCLDKVRKPSGGQKTVRELLDQNYKTDDQAVETVLMEGDKLSLNSAECKMDTTNYQYHYSAKSDMKSEIKSEAALTSSTAISASSADGNLQVHPLGIPSPMFFPPQLIPMGPQIPGVTQMSLPVMIPQFQLPFNMQSSSPVMEVKKATSPIDIRPLHALNKLVPPDSGQPNGPVNLDSRYNAIHSSHNLGIQRNGSQSHTGKAPPPSNHIQSAHQSSHTSSVSSNRAITPAHSYKHSYSSFMKSDPSAVPTYHIPTHSFSPLYPRDTPPTDFSISSITDKSKQQKRFSSQSDSGYKVTNSESVGDEAPVLDLSMKTMRAQEAKHTKDTVSLYNKENKGTSNYSFDTPQDLSYKSKSSSPCDFSKRSTVSEGYRNTLLNVPSHFTSVSAPPSEYFSSSKVDNSNLIGHAMETSEMEKYNNGLTVPPFSVTSLPMDLAGAFVHPAFPASPFMVPPGVFPTPIQLQQMIQGQVAPGLASSAVSTSSSTEYSHPPSVLFPASSMPRRSTPSNR